MMKEERARRRHNRSNCEPMKSRCQHVVLPERRKEGRRRWKPERRFLVVLLVLSTLLCSTEVAEGAYDWRNKPRRKREVRKPEGLPITNGRKTERRRRRGRFVRRWLQVEPASTVSPQPTVSPAPTVSPLPTISPEPTVAPKVPPTEAPVQAPPTDPPVKAPTDPPTESPVTDPPTGSPTTNPTDQPVKAPTDQPTIAPSTGSPSPDPTESPTTESPTTDPTESTGPDPTGTLPDATDAPVLSTFPPYLAPVPNDHAPVLDTATPTVARKPTAPKSSPNGSPTPSSIPTVSEAPSPKPTSAPTVFEAPSPLPTLPDATDAPVLSTLPPYLAPVPNNPAPVKGTSQPTGTLPDTTDAPVPSTLPPFVAPAPSDPAPMEAASPAPVLSTAAPTISRKPTAPKSSPNGSPTPSSAPTVSEAPSPVPTESPPVGATSTTDPPSKSPSLVPTEAPSLVLAAALDASCSAYPACEGLDNDCCPTEMGVFLDCCTQESPSSTSDPTVSPTSQPVPAPIVRTPDPTRFPTPAPFAEINTPMPVTPMPVTPSPTRAPQEAPQTEPPTESPVASPVQSPIREPSPRPTPRPTRPPTTRAPVEDPISAPTERPTRSPTTRSPSAAPSPAPSPSPSAAPSPAPSLRPSGSPSAPPSVSQQPSVSASPSAAPTPVYEYEKEVLRGEGIVVKGSVETNRRLVDQSPNCTELWPIYVRNRIEEEVIKIVPIRETLDVELYNTTQLFRPNASEVLLIFSILIEIRSPVESHDVNRYVEGPFDSPTEKQAFVEFLKSTGCEQFANVNGVDLILPESQESRSSDGKDSAQAGLIAGLVVAILALLMLAATFIYLRMRSRRIVVSDEDDMPLFSGQEASKSNEYASEIGVKTDAEVSTLSDPVPIAVIRAVDGSTVESASLDYDYQKAYLDQHSATTSQLTGSAGESKESGGESFLSHGVVQTDDDTFGGQYLATEHAPEEKFEVMAPPGLLGLILETSRDDGFPTVNSIKPSSVLVHVVAVGDRLLSVDGDDVTTMRASDVSQLIAGKKHHSVRKLVFSRQTKRPYTLED